MLSKTHKLTRISFPKHAEPKKIWLGFSLRVQYSFNDSLKNTLFAVVVPKKAYSSAVQRNSFKRMVFHSIELISSKYTNNKPMKVVIFPNKDKKTHTNENINGDILRFYAELYK